VYEYSGQVRDFYKELFNRESIDGNGMKIVSTENFGHNYENAFWNGAQMTYGSPSADSPISTVVLLDVCGHEMTHGVTSAEQPLEYFGQSGALNESISDVFGILIKQKANHQSAADSNWVIGEGFWKAGIKGRGLRDMMHPGTAYDDPKIGKDDQPDSMSGYIKTQQDHGGVHMNSGIPNRAFALFATDVGGNAWEEPGKIWYETRKAVGPHPSFAQFAYYSIESAKKLGFDSDVPKLEKAWEAVGVTPSESETDTLTPPRPQPQDAPHSSG
jgi:Zn-dependent metalloprotease